MTPQVAMSTLLTKPLLNECTGTLYDKRATICSTADRIWPKDFAYTSSARRNGSPTSSSSGETRHRPRSKAANRVAADNRSPGVPPGGRDEGSTEHQEAGELTQCKRAANCRGPQLNNEPALSTRHRQDKVGLF